VDLTDAVAIVVPRPLVVGVAYRRARAAHPGQTVVSAPLVGVDRHHRPTRPHHHPLQGLPVGSLGHRESDVPALTTDHTAHRRPVIVPIAMAPCLVTLQSIRREFLLDLSTGFVYDVIRDHAASLDMAEHRRTVLEHFSGTLCVDELHLGRFTLLLATDPLSDLPVAFALVAKNDREHMERFLRNLKTWGLVPRVVVTDGSNLYPAVLAELWPTADHQLCVFHTVRTQSRTETAG
jgi:hypothetical protein